MVGALQIVWSKLVHDLTLYEHEVHPQVLGNYKFSGEPEPEEAREERLHTETAGAPGPQM